MKIYLQAFVLLLCLSASWASPGKKTKRGIFHGESNHLPIASGHIEVGGGHLDIPPVSSLPLEGGDHLGGGLAGAGAFSGNF